MCSGATTMLFSLSIFLRPHQNGPPNGPGGTGKLSVPAIELEHVTGSKPPWTYSSNRLPWRHVVRRSTFLVPVRRFRFMCSMPPCTAAGRFRRKECRSCVCPCLRWMLHGIGQVHPKAGGCWQFESFTNQIPDRQAGRQAGRADRQNKLDHFD